MRNTQGALPVLSGVSSVDGVDGVDGVNVVDGTGDVERLTCAIRALLRDRGAGKTICPSEAARAVDPESYLAKAKYADAYRGIDFRAHPELYRVGRGEQGVLVAEPYKSELLPLWRFRIEAIARTSAAALWAAFVAYRRARDFVGMDMARKYLQMGFTRARRYANHRTGRKWAARDVGRPRATRDALPLEADPEKAKAASVFYEHWQKAERDRTYAAWRRRSAEAHERRTR